MLSRWLLKVRPKFADAYKVSGLAGGAGVVPPPPDAQASRSASPDGSHVKPRRRHENPDRLKDQRTILSAWTWTPLRISRIFSGC
jgi:hypothetical protein